MKLKLSLFYAIIPILILAQKPDFNKYFSDSTLRIDYILMVSNDTTIASLQQLKLETPWAGTRNHLISPVDYGNYLISVYDSASGNLIFTYGYSSLSAEWRFIPNSAKSQVFRSFYESVSIPYPKKTIRFVLKYRDRSLGQHLVLDTFINPTSIYIVRHDPLQYPVKDLLINGNYTEKVDLVFLPEGYTSEQMQDFLADAQKFLDVLFQYEPFASNKDKFNVRAVLSPSPESGTDNPGANVWRNTLFDSHFYTFQIPRYLTVENYFKVKDVAANAPYDHIIILVNTADYGGGGFYNFLSITTAKNAFAKPVFVHEFGHAFGGLADEYVDQDPQTQQFYDKTKEPWEPNITTLVNFDIKWKHLVADTVPIPTPATEEYSNVIGVFEGAGYSPKGIYRPQQNCLMRSLGYGFCKVCQISIKQIIDYYTQ